MSYFLDDRPTHKLISTSSQKTVREQQMALLTRDPLSFFFCPSSSAFENNQRLSDEPRL